MVIIANKATEMTVSNFAKSLALVLVQEGGYVNNLKDPGGATQQGITQAVYSAWCRLHDLTAGSVRYMPSGTRDAIYKAQYWDAIRGDQLPVGVDYCLFDEGVNSGPRKSIVDLQTALGIKADGVFGTITLEALSNVKDYASLVNKVCDLRLSWLHRLTTFRWFGKGWSTRVNFVRKNALAMVQAA